MLGTGAALEPDSLEQTQLFRYQRDFGQVTQIGRALVCFRILKQNWHPGSGLKIK